MFAVRLCIFFCTIVPVAGATNAHKYKKLWNRCSNDTPFLVLRNIAMEKCVSECHVRNACLAVNYWTRRSQCDMQLEDTAYQLQKENNTQPCVYVRKADFEPAYQPLTCQPCDDKTVCDIETGGCVIKECRQLLVPNATIKGNILSVGSKIRIYCDEQFDQRPNETLSICQENGTWSNVPTCHYLPEFVCPSDGDSFHHTFLQDGTEIQIRAFLDTTRDFNAALAKCEAEGGSLYKILTLAKMNFTLQLMNCPVYPSCDYCDYWIDGVYNTATSSWNTTDGTPLPTTQDFWYPGEPMNPGPGRCIMIKASRGYRWDDKDCDRSKSRYALCEIF